MTAPIYSRHQTTQRVLESFLAGQVDRRSEAFATVPHKLLSYRTCLLERAADGAYLVNATDYSRTTSRHQHGMLAMLQANRAVFVTRWYRAVPAGTDSLVDYERRAGHLAHLGLISVAQEAARSGLPEGSPRVAEIIRDRVQAREVLPLYGA